MTRNTSFMPNVASCGSRCAIRSSNTRLSSSMVVAVNAKTSERRAPLLLGRLKKPPPLGGVEIFALRYFRIPKGPKSVRLSLHGSAWFPPLKQNGRFCFVGGLNLRAAMQMPEAKTLRSAKAQPDPRTNAVRLLPGLLLVNQRVQAPAELRRCGVMLYQHAVPSSGIYEKK